jgi:riboflavin kinase/FMN adenylyltransferase
MRVIRNKPGQLFAGSSASRPSVVAIGNFDGMHRGHMALIERCREKAAADDVVAMLTFEPLPQAFFRPGQPPARLSTVYQKLCAFQSAGVDLVWLMRFGIELASLSAREFVEQVLQADMRVKCVVIGEDFLFGRGREGDVVMLKQFGAEMDFAVETVAAVECGGQRISSSRIRHQLAAGDFQSAAECLGRPFRMEGYVVRGANLGKKLGYPTANLKIRARPSPLQGVFAVYARCAGDRWRAGVSNLGWRPAVNGKEPLLEVHFFDFDKDLYGQRLEVQFVAKLRDELNFKSIDDLVVQMKSDEAQARACLAQISMPEDQY